MHTAAWGHGMRCGHRIVGRDNVYSFLLGIISVDHYCFDYLSGKINSNSIIGKLNVLIFLGVGQAIGIVSGT